MWPYKHKRPKPKPKPNKKENKNQSQNQTKKTHLHFNRAWSFTWVPGASSTPPGCSYSPPHNAQQCNKVTPRSHGLNLSRGPDALGLMQHRVPERQAQTAQGLVHSPVQHQRPGRWQPGPVPCSNRPRSHPLALLHQDR